MKKIKVIIEHSDKNFSAYIENLPIFTVGNSVQEVKANINEAIALYVEDNPHVDPILQGEYELQYIIDIETFLNYYSNIFTKAALSRITGINQRQLWHYAAGKHKPRKMQIEKIQQGIDHFVKNLSEFTLG